ncbi:MAG: aminotransferase class I/II-fold pyridoxal phosphate-dependent enzyme [Anaerolineales bacterium]
MTSKYIANRVATLKPSGIRKFFDIAASMPDVISLGIGEPDFVTPKPILEAGIASLQGGATGYTSNAGVMDLREAVSAHLQRMYGVSYDPATEIMISVGVSEALYLALTAILEPGEEVIIPTPCFVSYQAEVILAGGVPVEIPSRFEDDFQPDVQAIADAVTEKTKAILVGYPNNPTGAVASRENLIEIGKIAEQHDLVMLSDEIYDQLVYGVEHVCFPALPDMRPRTILLGGFSKDYAMTGWRVGFAAAPAEILQGLLRIHQYTVMCAPTTSQMAALKALQVGAPFVAEMQAEYDRRRRLIVDAFNEFGMPTFEPCGAFYAFPKISIPGMDDDQFAMELLKSEMVAVVPGSAFGPGGEGFIRCSYATAYEKIEQAMERVGRFIGKHR